MKDISHSSCSTETAPEGGWQVQHPPIILAITLFLNTNRGQRQFKGKGSICLHSRAASMLLKQSDSWCLWVLEAHNLLVLPWRATGHLMRGKGYKRSGCEVVSEHTPPPKIAIAQTTKAGGGSRVLTPYTWERVSGGWGDRVYSNWRASLASGLQLDTWMVTRVKFWWLVPFWI